jgi:aminoglycoside phosphotransferase (APT) family kinase protein
LLQKAFRQKEYPSFRLEHHLCAPHLFNNDTLYECYTDEPMKLFDVQARVEAYLKREEALGADVCVTALTPLSGGACQENFRVDIALRQIKSSLVLRSDAASALPGSINRAKEFAVIESAVSAAVRTPRARYLGLGLVREGAHAYFMEWAEGEAIGRKVTKSPDLEGARALLPAQLGDELAKIHAIPASSPSLSLALGALPKNPVQSALSLQRTRMDALRSKRLGIELVYAWLCANTPEPEQTVLVHGDFRTGNFLVTPEGLSAILDWEFARFGSRYEDLAWISLRDWRFGALNKPVGGFAKRESFYEAYEKRSKHVVDVKKILYFEVLGNLAWAVGSVAQAERYLHGGDRDIELLAIGRRAAEMEWEAVRLIEKGSL